MNGWALAALITIVAIIVVIRRLRGEPLNARDLFGAPLVLTGLGIWALCEADGLTGTDLVWVVAGSVLGIALGALRGATVQVFGKEGVLWQRYTGRTFLIALGSLLIMAGYGFLAARLGMHANARPVQLSIGVGFLGEALAVGFRGLASGIPFAPERERRR
ncbi:DUF1453 domain-containing protein [Streptomyces syringium]|uniref:DUF1453 domain-containing protein n=1 Tax=Streptomyces syringium TaxID=76729 RepID=UPI00340C774A